MNARKWNHRAWFCFCQSRCDSCFWLERQEYLPPKTLSHTVVKLVVENLLPATQTLRKTSGGVGEGVRRFDSWPSRLGCRDAMPCATSRFCGGRPGEEGGHLLHKTEVVVSVAGFFLNFFLFFPSWKWGERGTRRHPAPVQTWNLDSNRPQTPSPSRRGVPAPAGRSEARGGSSSANFPFPLPRRLSPSSSLLPVLLGSPMAMAERPGSTGGAPLPVWTLPGPRGRSQSDISTFSSRRTCLLRSNVGGSGKGEGGESPCVRGPRAEMNWGIREKILLHTLSCLPDLGLSSLGSQSVGPCCTACLLCALRWCSRSSQLFILIFSGLNELQ